MEEKDRNKKDSKEGAGDRKNRSRDLNIYNLSIFLSFLGFTKEKKMRVLSLHIRPVKVIVSHYSFQPTRLKTNYSPWFIVS